MPPPPCISCIPIFLTDVGKLGRDFLLGVLGALGAGEGSNLIPGFHFYCIILFLKGTVKEK